MPPHRKPKLQGRTRNDSLSAQDARIEAAARRLRGPLERWLGKLASKITAQAVGDLQSGKIKVQKAAPPTDQELIDLLTKFGLLQIKTAGRDVAAGLGGKWVTPPQLAATVRRQKAVLVQNIMKETRAAVRGQLRKMLLDASKEKPIPSIGEIARRIRNTYLGPKDQRPMVVNPARAMLIARTEAVQTENTGIQQGMAIAGVAWIEWRAHTDGKSGDRHHERMNGKRITMAGSRGSDKTKWFQTPLGNQLRFPGDPTGPIKETANCRCTIVPRRAGK